MSFKDRLEIEIVKHTLYTLLFIAVIVGVSYLTIAVFGDYAKNVVLR